MHSNKVKLTRNDRIFNVILYILAAISLVIVLYPMYFIIIASFSDPVEVSQGNIVFLPKNPSLAGYKELLKYDQIWIGYRNTILYVICGTIFGLMVNVPTAYVLSRKDLVGRKFLTWFFLIPMFFTGGLIPTYLVVKNSGLLDSFWVMVIPFAVVPYYILVGKTFFQTSLPNDLWESAQLDGCGNLRFFVQFVLPLSKAIIAVIALWTAVGIWNSYFNAMIYLRSESLKPLQLVLRNILINQQTLAQMGTGAAVMEAQKTATLIKYCAIVVSSLPIMCMYPFVQKYFNQGVMIGSLKG